MNIKQYLLLGTIMSVTVAGWYYVERAQKTTLTIGDQQGGWDAPQQKTSGNTAKSSIVVTSPAASRAHKTVDRTNLTATTKNSEADTSKDHQKSFDDMWQMSVETLWQYWQGLMNQGSYADREVATAALAQKLQQEGNDRLYLEAADLLRNPTLSAEQRALVVNLLGQTATKKAMEILIDVLRWGGDETLRTAIGEGLKDAANKLWDGRFHSELSPPLEAAWGEKYADPNLLYAIAESLAKVGAPAGVKLLLTTIAAEKKTVDEIYSSNNLKSNVALQVMTDIRNPEALPILAKSFTSHSLGEAVFEASGDGLAGVGTAEATQILIEWVKQAPDSATPLVERWVRMIQDDKSIELLRDATSTKTAFASPQVKQALVEALGE